MDMPIIIDPKWRDSRYYRPVKNGRYHVIVDGWETRATYRNGKWSRNVEAFKGEYERRQEEDDWTSATS